MAPKVDRVRSPAESAQLPLPESPDAGGIRCPVHEDDFWAVSHALRARHEHTRPHRLQCSLDAGRQAHICAWCIREQSRTKRSSQLPARGMEPLTDPGCPGPARMAAVRSRRWRATQPDEEAGVDIEPRPVTDAPDTSLNVDHVNRVTRRTVPSPRLTNEPVTLECRMAIARPVGPALRRAGRGRGGTRGYCAASRPWAPG